MSPEHLSFKILFFKNWKKEIITDVEDFLVVMSETIPECNFYYEQRVNDATTQEAMEYAQDEQDKGNTLYMITDDPDIVHWISFDKRYYPLVNLIRKNLVNIETEFLEPFNAVDMEP